MIKKWYQSYKELQKELQRKNEGWRKWWWSLQSPISGMVFNIEVGVCREGCWWGRCRLLVQLWWRCRLLEWLWWRCSPQEKGGPSLFNNISIVLLDTSQVVNLYYLVYFCRSVLVWLRSISAPRNTDEVSDSLLEKLADQGLKRQAHPIKRSQYSRTPLNWILTHIYIYILELFDTFW